MVLVEARLQREGGARELVHALRGFFKLHPEYAKNPFWVTGESYGGHYVPNVARRLCDPHRRPLDTVGCRGDQRGMRAPF